MFGGPFSGNFMSPDNTSDGWLRKKWVIQNQRRVLLKSGSGESQQEPLNEVLANMICDRLKHCHSKPFCKYHEEQIALIQNIERYEFQNIDHVHVMFRAQLRTELSKFINAYKSASSRHYSRSDPSIH